MLAMTEGYVAAMYIHTIGIPADQFNRLDGHFADSDSPECTRRTVAGLGYFQVEAIRGSAAQRVLQEAENEIERLMLEREVPWAERRRGK